MKESSRWLCFVAGKSGGHIVPALHLAHVAQTEAPTNIMFFSMDTDLDHSILDQQKISLHIPLSCSLLYRSIFVRPLALAQLGYAWLKSMFYLIRHRPQRIVSTGGLVSIPVVLAGRALRIPITVYNLDATPGKAARFTARFATEVCVCFDVVRPLFPAHSIKRVDYPHRFTPADKQSMQAARAQLNIPQQACVILLLGGSQGSAFLNSWLTSYVEKLQQNAPETAKNIYIIHQAGNRNLAELKAWYADHGVTADVFAYRNDIASAYCAADFVIARAGAGTLFELLFFQKQAIIVPLETKATDHQLDNAYAMAALHPKQFTVIRQTDCITKTDSLTNLIEQALSARKST